MIKTVRHSGMKFIDDNAFHIENSPTYTRLKEEKSIKSVELILSKGNKLLFIEAKSSFPNPNNPMPNPDKGYKTGSELFREEIKNICDKFIHPLNLYSAIKIGVAEGEFPQEYNPSKKVSLVFVLVIRCFERPWCSYIERALKNRIFESICIEKIWKPEVHVLNHEAAIQRNLTAGLCT